MTSVIMLKLGGGLIAPKNWLEETPDKKTIERLSREILESGKKVIVVSGSGNFGHKAVRRYGIDTAEAVEAVRKSARRIGEIVSGYLPNSVLLEPHKTLTEDPGKVLEAIGGGRTPVLYGDVMDKIGGGWEVFSGERIIAKIIPELIVGGFEVERVVQVSVEEGVLNTNGGVISNISDGNWKGIRPDVGKALGVDVTGGMLHKVEESLEIFRKYTVRTMVISGKVEGRLREALEGKEVAGTIIG